MYKNINWCDLYRGDRYLGYFFFYVVKLLIQLVNRIYVIFLYLGLFVVQFFQGNVFVFYFLEEVLGQRKKVCNFDGFWKYENKSCVLSY